MKFTNATKPRQEIRVSHDVLCREMREISRILTVCTSAPSEIPRVTWREQLISHLNRSL
jgi:hypothetical protein